ncbi:MULTISPECIES: HAMP domain-containing sensor histidine kinase [Rhodococcus]|nr:MULTISPECIES: HAMP domain-containing sensor histidine kinase [Rhodococcus]EID81398.1 putative two-component histidine kinase [Rhodococcus opacus RKJ300 = JCM 13270]UOT07946.1 HAMP domain-containing histidine kinase [Rhodococcus opacus]
MDGIWPLLHPRRWGLRIRSAIIAGVVVAVAVGFAAIALTLVLYRSMISASDDAAAARIQEVSAQLRLDTPDELDAATVSVNPRVTLVQVIDPQGRVVRSSAAGPTEPVTAVRPPEGALVHGARPAPRTDGLRVSAYTTTGVGGRYTVVVATSVENIENTIKTVAVLVALGAPFIVAVAALATYALIGRSLRSVEKIRTRVAAISSSDLAERVPVPTQHDEIAALAETMNAMLSRIESGQHAQRRFVADASHELRSPLSTVTTALEIGRDRPELLDTALVEHTLLPEAARMHHLIDDLLLLARADEHGLPLRIVDVDIDDVVASEVHRKRAEGGATFSCVLEPVQVRGDATQISRVVRNLVDNAARYATTTVRVRVSSDSVTARIEVSDDGPGIPETERDRVFERFFRLQRDRARGSGGSGLGLAIVAEIVTAHHGTVHIDTNPDGGATAIVHLPVRGTTPHSTKKPELPEPGYTD